MGNTLEMCILPIYAMCNDAFEANVRYVDVLGLCYRRSSFTNCENLVVDAAWLLVCIKSRLHSLPEQVADGLNDQSDHECKHLY